METNLTKLKKELHSLIDKGELLHYRLILDLGLADAEVKKELENYQLPLFKEEYEQWYSLSMQIIKQILPDRLDDFTKAYKNEKRKETDSLTYTISDYLIGVKVIRGGQVVVDLTAALPKFQQQLNILKSSQVRFESSLFDMTHVLQADIFDDELDSARELLRKGFLRGAGAIAGVVIEKHLSSACKNHNLSSPKKNPTINDYNQILKDNAAIDAPTWRFIQHLADLRNLCSHNKEQEPKAEQVSDLIEGGSKVIKTVF